MSLDQRLEHILREEVHLHFSKSHGHGGQNVNKRKTKAELYFNIQDSHFLTEEEKELLITHASQYVHHHEKILIMTSQEERYQKANKKKVIAHFKHIFKESLTSVPERKEPGIPYHAMRKG